MFPFKFLTAFCYQVGYLYVCVCVSVCACVRECKLLKEWFSPLLCDRLLELVIRFLLAKKKFQTCAGFQSTRIDAVVGQWMSTSEMDQPNQASQRAHLSQIATTFPAPITVSSHYPPHPAPNPKVENFPKGNGVWGTMSRKARGFMAWQHGVTYIGKVANK